jgi:hypothetical protein
LDADWPCYFFDLNEGFRLGYMLSCAFDPQPEVTKDIIDADFTYEVQYPGVGH